MSRKRALPVDSGEEQVATTPIATKSTKLVAFGTAGVLMAGTLGGLGMSEAQAGAKGRRNTAIGLGAVTAYGLLKKKKTLAIAGGIGTALAYSKYRKAKKQEDRDEARRVQWYKNRYGRNWRNHYKPGA